MKNLSTVILIFLSIGTLAIAAMEFGDAFIVAMLMVLGTWFLGLAWLLNFCSRVSARTRLTLTIVLVLFPLFFYAAWTNFWRLETYAAYSDWTTYTSRHFRFHYAPDYPRAHEIGTFAETHDAAFDSICFTLSVTYNGLTDFFVHDILIEGIAIPEWNVIRADDDQSVGHEMTHIIAYHIAGERQKVRLLDEGLATWLNRSTVTKDHHRAAWEYLQNNGLPPLRELIPGPAFRHHRPAPYFPAASFVGFLISRFGVDAFRRLWTANAAFPELFSNAEDLHLVRYIPWISLTSHVESTVMEVYGRTLTGLDEEWRAWLDRQYRH